jgi:hypothetical protein
LGYYTATITAPDLYRTSYRTSGILLVSDLWFLNGVINLGGVFVGQVLDEQRDDRRKGREG